MRMAKDWRPAVRRETRAYGTLRLARKSRSCAVMQTLSQPSLSTPAGHILPHLVGMEQGRFGTFLRVMRCLPSAATPVLSLPSHTVQTESESPQPALMVPRNYGTPPREKNCSRSLGTVQH